MRYLSQFYFVAPPKIFLAGTPISVRNSAYSDMAALVYRVVGLLVYNVFICKVSSKPHFHSHTFGFEM